MLTLSQSLSGVTDAAAAPKGPIESSAVTSVLVCVFFASLPRQPWGVCVRYVCLSPERMSRYVTLSLCSDVS